MCLFLGDAERCKWWMVEFGIISGTCRAQAKIEIAGGGVCYPTKRQSKAITGLCMYTSHAVIFDSTTLPDSTVNLYLQSFLYASNAWAEIFIFKMKTILVVTFFSIVYCSEEQCTTQGKCKQPDASKYSAESNEIISNIEKALREYVPCNKTNCDCYHNTLMSDLEKFKIGIPKEIFNAVADKVSVKYQIIDHVLYRQKECMFPSRCSGIEYLIKRVIKDLPNMEMIINCRDWPQIHKRFHKMGPVFSFSKTDEYYDIMYPTWGFWEGGPAISLYPTGLGRWDKHRISLTKASEKWPWDKKLTKAFFRGSRTSDERDSLVLLSREDGELVDAQYTKNQAWKSPKDTLEAEPAKEIPLEEHCQYKYLFNFRGVAASFRFKHLFMCKSLVFHVGDEWKEFFYDSLKPWVHYVPLQSYPSKDRIRSVLEFFKQHDDLAKDIAERGFNFINEHLRMDDILCYWRRLLRRYAKFLKYEVTRDNELLEV